MRLRPFIFAILGMFLVQNASGQQNQPQLGIVQVQFNDEVKFNPSGDLLSVGFKITYVPPPQGISKKPAETLKIRLTSFKGNTQLGYFDTTVSFPYSALTKGPNSKYCDVNIFWFLYKTNLPLVCELSSVCDRLSLEFRFTPRDEDFNQMNEKPVLANNILGFLSNDIGLKKRMLWETLMRECKEVFDSLLTDKTYSREVLKEVVKSQDYDGIRRMLDSLLDALGALPRTVAKVDALLRELEKYLGDNKHWAEIADNIFSSHICELGKQVATNTAKEINLFKMDWDIGLVGSRMAQYGQFNYGLAINFEHSHEFNYVVGLRGTLCALGQSYFRGEGGFKGVQGSVGLIVNLKLKPGSTGFRCVFLDFGGIDIENQERDGRIKGFSDASAGVDYVFDSSDSGGVNSEALLSIFPFYQSRHLFPSKADDVPRNSYGLGIRLPIRIDWFKLVPEFHWLWTPMQLSCNLYALFNFRP